MLVYLLSRITRSASYLSCGSVLTLDCSATGAFVYPAYASYKTLSRRPASEADVERWLMYW